MMVVLMVVVYLEFNAATPGNTYGDRDKRTEKKG